MPRASRAGLDPRSAVTSGSSNSMQLGVMGSSEWVVVAAARQPLAGVMGEAARWE